MKIGQVLLFYPPVIGGVETFVHELSKGLVGKGHEVHVFTLSKRSHKILGPDHEIVGGVRVHRISPWLDLSYRGKLWPGLLRELSGAKLQLVHSYCQGHFHTLASSLVSRIARKIPFIVTSYGPLAQQSNYHPVERAMLSLYDATVTPALFGISDLIVARNPGVTPWLKSLGLGPEKIIETRPGIPSEFLESTFTRGRAKEELGLRDKRVVLYLGRISQQKGLEYFVKSVPTTRKYDSDSMFLIVGPDEGFVSRLEQLSSSLGVADCLRFEGPVSDVESELRFYSCCDVFVMPSSFEGFGQAVVKAMALGKPVVASNVGALPFLIRDGVNGRLVPFGDYHALGEAVGKLLVSAEMRAEIGLKARETVKDFRFDNIVDQMESVYRKVVQRFSA